MRLLGEIQVPLFLDVGFILRTNQGNRVANVLCARRGRGRVTRERALFELGRWTPHADDAKPRNLFSRACSRVAWTSLEALSTKRQAGNKREIEIPCGAHGNYVAVNNDGDNQTRTFQTRLWRINYFHSSFLPRVAGRTAPTAIQTEDKRESRSRIIRAGEERREAKGRGR